MNPQSSGDVSRIIPLFPIGLFWKAFVAYVRLLNEGKRGPFMLNEKFKYRLRSYLVFAKFFPNFNKIKGKRKMHLKRNMSKSTVIALALLMVSAALSALQIQPVHAQLATVQPISGPLPVGTAPNITITTEAYLSFRPNPVGLGQTFLVNTWLHPPINVQRQFTKAFQVTLTKPDGTKDVIGPMDSFCGDSTGWFEYVADQIGTWKIKFVFLGMYFPAGRYLSGFIVTNTSGTVIDSAYYKPSSTAEIQLSVQEELVASWPPAPLPTDYWTRPVLPHNREWWLILGNFPATGIVGGDPNWPANTNRYMSNYNFIPYVQAPNTPHAVWYRYDADGGLVGGATGYTSLSPRGGTTEVTAPNIIYAGRCYRTITKASSTGTSSQNYWECFDLRTGEVYWEIPLQAGQSAPTMLTYEPAGSEVPGAQEALGAWRVYGVAVTAGTAGRIIKYDLFTGTVAVNITGPPSGISAGTFYDDPWMLSVQTLGGGNYRLINWTIANNAGYEVTASYGAQPIVDNFTRRIWGNITWPFSSLGTVDFESGVAVNTAGISSSGTGTSIGQRIMAASLTTGQLLWNITTDLSTGLETFFSGNNAVADHGKFAVRMQNGQYYCWDLNTGKLLWKSRLSSWPWGVFSAYSVHSAYGLIYTFDYVGVHAIDWETGQTAWIYNAPTPYEFETPYQGNYSWHSSGMVVDGKIYAMTNEHSPQLPLTRGWKLHCINATTGEGIWNTIGWSNVGGGRAFPGAFADGYLAFFNWYQGFLYVYGKGKSATTVTAPDIVVSKGNGVVIKGTVLDISPAQPGTPCVAKESMALQMEYLHMQMPIDGIWHNETITGVPVTLIAMDSNGTAINIGAVTTNGYYGTFCIEWTPPNTGTYEIIASFAGDGSYGSSAASTMVSVGAAAATAQPSETSPPIEMAPLYYDLAVGVIVIVIAIAIATVLILRKH